MRRFMTVGVSFVILMALVLAGCGSKKAAPTLKVTAQQENAGLVIRMDITGFALGKDGHAHIQLDDGPIAMPVQAIYRIPRVTPGKHKVFVQLADLKHNPLGVSQTVDVEVK